MKNTDIFKRSSMIAMATAAVAMGVAAGLHWFKRPTLQAVNLQAWWAGESESLDGQLWRHSAWQGQPLLVNFWATWCPPCVEELPLIDSFYSQNLEKGWQVIGFAIDKPELVKRFIAQHQLHFPQVMAASTGLQWSRLLGNEAGSLPFSVIFDKLGQLQLRHTGRIDQNLLNEWRDRYST